jgi:hypothetical protein
VPVFDWGESITIIGYGFMAQFSQPRELKSNERVLLEYLLSADFPGRNELKEQLSRVEVVGDCDCGCGTIYLAVKEPFVRACSREPIAVEAYADALDVMLFVRDGLLASLEIVDYVNVHPLNYPSPSTLKLWVPPNSR